MLFVVLIVVLSIQILLYVDGIVACSKIFGPIKEMLSIEVPIIGRGFKVTAFYELKHSE